jgi:lipopolysaccharide export system permease protein
MAVNFARSGAFMGVLLSIFLVLLYYNAYVISTEILGRNSWVSPVVAAWLPNVVFLVLGLVFLRRAE